MPIFTAGTSDDAQDFRFENIARFLVDIDAGGVARPGPTSQQFEVYSPLSAITYRFFGNGMSGFGADGLPTSGTITGLSMIDPTTGLSTFTASLLHISAAQLSSIIANRDASTLMNLLFSGSDTITGSTSTPGDWLFGYGGNDTITPGGGGSDYVDGGSGDDVIIIREPVGTGNFHGGAGADTLVLEVAAGVVIPPGFFRAYDFRGATVSGIETVRFDGSESVGIVFSVSQIGSTLPVNQTVQGSVGTNYLVFTAGNGSAWPSGGTYSLESLNLNLVNWEAQDYVWLRVDMNQYPFADGFTLIGSMHRDVISGEGGPDLLRGGLSADRLRGFDGADVFEVRSGDFAPGELIDGGTGLDTLRTVGLNNDYRVGTIVSIERIQFQQLAGEATTNAMIDASQIGSGFANNLVVSGSAAQDSVQIFAGSGATVDTSGWTFDFPAWSFADYLVYVGDVGDESFIGFPGLDIYFGSPGNDTFDGRGAFDFAAYIFSPFAVTADLAISGPQFIGGNQGSDTFLNLEGLAGSQLNDVLYGDHQDNILMGMYGNDVLYGRAGNDDIRGYEGSDIIEGGMGADILWGAAEVFAGPDGADTFRYRNAAEGGDTIRDFQSGIDRIEVSAAGFGGGLIVGGTVNLTANAAPVASGGGGQFLYNTSNGALLWDADGAGAGAAVHIATLANAPTLTAASFVVSGLSGASLLGGEPGDPLESFGAGKVIDLLETSPPETMEDSFDFDAVVLVAAKSDDVLETLPPDIFGAMDDSFGVEADTLLPDVFVFDARFGDDGMLTLLGQDVMAA